LGRPLLRPEVKGKIWNQMRLDLEWLYEVYGFRFSISSDENSEMLVDCDDDWRPRVLSDIIEYSQDVKNKLFFELVFQMSKARRKKSK
jgi:hypothetical protein